MQKVAAPARAMAEIAAIANGIARGSSDSKSNTISNSNAMNLYHYKPTPYYTFFSLSGSGLRPRPAANRHRRREQQRVLQVEARRSPLPYRFARQGERVLHLQQAPQDQHQRVHARAGNGPEAHVGVVPLDERG